MSKNLIATAKKRITGNDDAGASIVEWVMIMVAVVAVVVIVTGVIAGPITQRANTLVTTINGAP